MSADLVRYESADGVATLVMARTSARNALDDGLCTALRAAWQRFEASDDRVAVLASADPDYFCVGADVRSLPANMWHAVPGLGVEVTKPVIAAVSGWVVGGGFVIVQMADLCVASETTRFMYPEAKVGVTAGAASSVAARMPHKVAMEFLLLGEAMTAQRAYEVGFVNAVVPAGGQLAAAREMAGRLAGRAPLVVAALKSLVQETLPRGPLEQVAATRRILDRVAQSADAKEGPAAFQAKRPPRFTGR